jgi:hypothetical protein
VIDRNPSTKPPTGAVFLSPYPNIYSDRKPLILIMRMALGQPSKIKPTPTRDPSITATPDLTATAFQDDYHEERYIASEENLWEAYDYMERCPFTP